MSQSNSATRRLDDDQLEAFDTEYVTPRLWESISTTIRRDLPSGRFRFVDLGGGNGVFADRVLEAFPDANGVVLDNAETLLRRNAAHQRKRLVCGGIEDLGRLLGSEKFDVVFFNWVLHHLVTDSYRGSSESQTRALREASELLAPGGRLSVVENFYDGLVFDALPGKIIYALTASRALAPVTRRLGANTGGVGVCFRSHHDWISVLGAAGLEPLGVMEDFTWKTGISKRVALHIGSVRCGHVWCKVRGAS